MFPLDFWKKAVSCFLLPISIQRYREYILGFSKYFSNFSLCFFILLTSIFDRFRMCGIVIHLPFIMQFACGFSSVNLGTDFNFNIYNISVSGYMMPQIYYMITTAFHYLITVTKVLISVQLCNRFWELNIVMGDLLLLSNEYVRCLHIAQYLH